MHSGKMEIIGNCIVSNSDEASPTFSHTNSIFCVYRPYKEPISNEMNNHNDLNSHSITKCWAGFTTDQQKRTKICKLSLK